MQKITIFSVLLLTLLNTKPLENINLDFRIKPKILIVYNADSGLFNGLSDYIHKIVSPQTYQCNLCALTYGNLGMNKKWSDYLHNLAIPITFQHKDQIKNIVNLFPDTPLPAIFLSRNGEIKELLSAQEINRFSRVEGLISLMDKKLSACR